MAWVELNQFFFSFGFLGFVAVSHLGLLLFDELQKFQRQLVKINQLTLEDYLLVFLIEGLDEPEDGMTREFDKEFFGFVFSSLLLAGLGPYELAIEFLPE